MIIYICDCCGLEISRQVEDFGRAHPGKCQDAFKAFKEHVDNQLASELLRLEATKDEFVKARMGSTGKDASAH